MFCGECDYFEQQLIMLLVVYVGFVILLGFVVDWYFLNFKVELCGIEQKVEIVEWVEIFKEGLIVGDLIIIGFL